MRKYAIPVQARALIVALVACITALSLTACSGGGTMLVESDDGGVHVSTMGIADGDSGTGQVVIGEGQYICLNHAVDKGAFHISIEADDESVIFDDDVKGTSCDIIEVSPGTFTVSASASEAAGTLDVLAANIDDVIIGANENRERKSKTDDSSGPASGSVSDAVGQESGTVGESGVSAIFIGNNSQPFGDGKQGSDKIDTIWIYYDTGVFEQYAEIGDEDVLFSRGTYVLDGSFENPDDGSLAIRRTHKYKAEEGLQEYDSEHTYTFGELEDMGYHMLFPKRASQG